MKKTLNRALSVLFVLLLTFSSVGMAFAADPIALTAANIVEYPTASGSIYFGQKVSDGVTISGGKVAYNGVEVAGKFEFSNPEYVPDSAREAERASIKFVPDNSAEYTGFEIRRCRNVTFPVYQVTPVLVDENNPPVASKIEAGQRLEKSILSGGQVRHPFIPDEPDALKMKWRWKDPYTIVNEVGYYTAIIGFDGDGGYKAIYMEVYVGIVGESAEIEIAEKPVVNELTYDPNVTWKDVPLIGGKAVESGTNIEIKGTFEVADNLKDVVPQISCTEISVKFIPEDENQTGTTLSVSVVVKKAPVKFVDENGAEIVPELTVPYGTKIDLELANKLKKFVKAENPAVDFENLSLFGSLPHKGTTPSVGTHEFDARVSGSSNYEPALLKFRLIVEPAKISPTITGKGTLKIIVPGKLYRPEGTFDVYVNDELFKTGVKYNEGFEWTPASSGSYTFKAVYNPIENDNYIIDDIYVTYEDVKLSWTLSATGNADKTYTFGDTVTVTAPELDPSKPDKPYYVFSKWEVVEGDLELSKDAAKEATITFEMPDSNVKLNAVYRISLKLFFKHVISVIVAFLGNAWNTVCTFIKAVLPF